MAWFFHTQTIPRTKARVLAWLLCVAAAPVALVWGQTPAGIGEPTEQASARVQAQLAELQATQAQQQRALNQQRAVMRELRDILKNQWQTQAEQNTLNHQQVDINDRLSGEQIKQSALLLAFKAELAALRQRLEAMPPTQPGPGALRPEVF